MTGFMSKNARSSPRFSLYALRLAVMAVCLTPSVSRALPATSGISVTSGSRCSVSLVELSYDDPGADDAEFIELRVDSPSGTNAPPALVPPAGTMPGCNTSSHMDGGPSDAGSGSDGHAADARALGPLTLGDCGLSAIELVNGGAGACDVYRSIPVADVVVPTDGYVVLCAEDATLPGFDVTKAGNSALRAGWLQNGPTDGFRFLSAASDVTSSFGYEGMPGCFSSDAVALVPETGTIGTADDVNVFCGSAFTLLPDTSAKLRDAPACPHLVGLARDAGSSPPLSFADGGIVSFSSDAAPAPPVERAPGAAGSAFTSGDGFDASLVPFPKAKPTLPKPPSCSIGLHSTLNAGVAPVPGLTLFALCALRIRRRRRSRRSLPWPKPALRADSCARSGSSRPRSP